MKQTDMFEKKFIILQELSSAMAITDDINAIASLLLDLAISYAHAEKASLMMLTERNELFILAAKGLDQQFIRNYKSAIGEGIAGTVAKNRVPVLVKNVKENAVFKHFRRDHYRTTSFISCPIVSKDRLLGVLNINDKRDGSAFNADEFELIKTLANHAAIALENASLLSQLKLKALELEEINKKLIETDILKTEFLTRISHELRTPLNSVKGAIYFLRHTEAIAAQDRQEFHGIIATEIDNLISIVENLLSFLRQEDESRMIKKTVLNMGDIFREMQNSMVLHSLFLRRGVHLVIDIQDKALEVVGDKIKVVQLFTHLMEGLGHYLERGDALSIHADETDQVNVDISLSRPLPPQVGPILEDSHYLFKMENPRDQLKLYLAKSIAETHRWRLSAFDSDGKGHITLLIPKSTKEAFDIYVDRSMDSFVEFVSELLDIDICSIMLSDDLPSELTVKGAVGLDDEIIKRTKIKFGDKIAGWVAREGKPLFIEDIERDPRFSRKNISQYTTKSLLSLPLKIGDRVIGVLNLNNKKTFEPFTESDYRLASRISEQISHFVEMLYSDNYREEDMREFILSLDAVFATETSSASKRYLLPNLTNKILRHSESFRNMKSVRSLH